MAVSSFKIEIPDSELDLLKQKLQLARLDPRLKDERWSEDNGVTYQFMKDTVEFWRTEYDWRQEEARQNQMPQFTTPIEVSDFGTFDMHFVHSKSSDTNAIPLLFLHGWPGSFIEVGKILPILNKAGFHVVAPSLPGFGFSSYTDKPGFKGPQYAEAVHKIMLRLEYPKYVVQGGDWGSFIARNVALIYPEHALALHVNMLFMEKPESIPGNQEYTAFELARLQRTQQFFENGSDYSRIQASRSHTLGYGLHDSPVAMLAWMADKLFLWTDHYPWTPTEIITWTMMHYLPGPTTALAPYREIEARVQLDHAKQHKVGVPSGVSAFPRELGLVPRSWAETALNLVFWADHEDGGGHFAAYEKPDQLSGDMISFFQSVWKP